MRGGCFCRPSRLWGSLCCGLSSAEQIAKGTASARRRWPAMSLERLVLWCQPNRVSEVFSSDRVSPGCRHVLGHWNRRRRHRSRRHCHSRPSCARVGFAGVVHAVLSGCLLVDPKWTHGVRYKPLYRRSAECGWQRVPREACQSLQCDESIRRLFVCDKVWKMEDIGFPSKADFKLWHTSEKQTDVIGLLTTAEREAAIRSHLQRTGFFKFIALRFAIVLAVSSSASVVLPNSRLHANGSPDLGLLCERASSLHHSASPSRRRLFLKRFCAARLATRQPLCESPRNKQNKI